MRSAVKIFIFVLLAVSVGNGQEASREQKLQKMLDLNDQIRILEKDFLQPEAKDLEAARKENLSVFRLNPREKYDRKLMIQGGGSYYSFTKNSHNYQDTVQIGLAQDNLKVGFAGADYGFIADLGEISLANVSKETVEANFLFNYKPPVNLSEIRIEQSKMGSYEVNNIVYKNRLPAAVGHAYILRAIIFDEADVLVALKIHRKDADGSLIIFWKLLADFETPYLERIRAIQKTRQNSESKSDAQDYATVQMVQAVLLENKFVDVSVDATNDQVTLRGTVPKGKMAEVVRIVQETAKRKVRNELTEQR